MDKFSTRPNQRGYVTRQQMHLAAMAFWKKMNWQTPKDIVMCFSYSSAQIFLSIYVEVKVEHTRGMWSQIGSSFWCCRYFFRYDLEFCANRMAALWQFIRFCIWLYEILWVHRYKCNFYFLGLFLKYSQWINVPSDILWNHMQNISLFTFMKILTFIIDVSYLDRVIITRQKVIHFTDLDKFSD